MLACLGYSDSILIQKISWCCSNCGRGLVKIHVFGFFIGKLVRQEECVSQAPKPGLRGWGLPVPGGEGPGGLSGLRRLCEVVLKPPQLQRLPFLLLWLGRNPAVGRGLGWCFAPRHPAPRKSLLPSPDGNGNAWPEGDGIPPLPLTLWVENPPVPGQRGRMVLVAPPWGGESGLSAHTLGWQGISVTPCLLSVA